MRGFPAQKLREESQFFTSQASIASYFGSDTVSVNCHLAPFASAMYPSFTLSLKTGCLLLSLLTVFHPLFFALESWVTKHMFLGWFISSSLEGKAILFMKKGFTSSSGEHWHCGEMSFHRSLSLFGPYISFPLYALIWRARTRSGFSILIWFFFSIQAALKEGYCS